MIFPNLKKFSIHSILHIYENEYTKKDSKTHLYRFEKDDDLDLL